MGFSRDSADASPGSIVRLKSAKGTWRGKLPRRPQGLPAPPDPGKLRDALGQDLWTHWKKFRRRAQRGVPGPRSRNLDEAVHDLRSAARRFHSVARALPPSTRGKAVRRAIRTAERILDWTGSLRDAAVEREGLKQVVRRDSDVARGLRKDLEDGRRREAVKLAGRLKGLGLRKTDRRMRRYSTSLRKGGDAGGIASKMVAAAFDEVQEARRAADPTDPRSIHRLRIALKRFRYVVEFVEPAFSRSRGDRTSSVQSLQRTMGDLRDNEILASALSRRGRRAPELLQDTAAVLQKLERRHSQILTSFLKSVDSILRYWEGVVKAFRGVVRAN